MDCANALDPEKYSVSFISLNLFDPEKSIFKVVPLNPKIELYYFNFEFDNDYSITGYLRFITRKKESFKHFQSINELITKINPKLIHFHTSPRELILRNFLDLKVPCLFTDHLLRIGKKDLGIIKSTVLSVVFRKLYKGFHIIAVSEEIKKSLYQRSIISKKTPIHTILNGVNVDFFQRKENTTKPEGLVVVYISRIEEIKGHETLVKSWASLSDITDKKLYIAGPDGLNGKIQKLARQLDCMEDIEFTGAISDPRILLQKANLAVFPSHKEGLPLSLLEKMAMALPVIVSDIPELTSIITDAKNGLVFKKSNSSDLADKIRYLVTNPAISNALGQEARKTVVSEYNFSESLKKLESVYNKILN
ncbi:hypothetical protein CNR22_12555 [Sphingobacteriaceae bacterium]|nr:hypothetical protein CNR22_12555 [Sphingobacteriaceae bacterium]